MRTLLVADGGGHLAQLDLLRDRLAPAVHQPLWVTFDIAQARTLLASEDVVHSHFPTTRNLANAVRNYRLAKQVFDDHDIERLVSTGAGSAVPFMLVARRRGIPCHYIESATRVTGPSLSGRLLQSMPSVHLYRQMGSWGTPQWVQGPCVFDGFVPSERSNSTMQRILVSLGTHRFPFHRLVARLSDLLSDVNAEVVWQLGTTPTPSRGLPGHIQEDLPSSKFASLVASSDVVIGHAGTGLCLTALRHGRVPLLVPRRRQHREHTDDHQAELAGELHARGLVIAAEAADLELHHLQQAANLSVHHEEPPPFHLLE